MNGDAIASNDYGDFWCSGEHFEFLPDPNRGGNDGNPALPVTIYKLGTA